MLRPIFLKAFNRIFPNASAGTSENPSRGPNNFVKMSALKTRTRMAGDSESMQELASFDNDSSSEEHDEEQGIVHGAGGQRVVITGNDKTARVKEVELGTAVTGGILVRSETMVEVSRPRRDAE